MNDPSLIDVLNFVLLNDVYRLVHVAFLAILIHDNRSSKKLSQACLFCTRMRAA